VLAGKVEIEWGMQGRDGVWCAPGVDIADGAALHPPVYLGPDSKVEAGAIIHGPTVVGANTVIEQGGHLDRSIVWRNAYIGAHSEVRGSLLADEVNVRANAVVFENAVIADQTVIGHGAIVQPNVKIWPHKEVEAGAVVSTSIIWGSAGRRVLFGRRGVSGLINVDFTPDALARLGSAYASTLPLGSIVTINRDLAIPSRMLKRALASGIPSAGAEVRDLSAVPIPVARFYTCSTEAAGGVHVRISSYDRSVCHIAFFDRNGMDLDKGTQRKIETAFFREDFRRAHIDDIGTTVYATDVRERYTQAFLAVIDRESIGRAGYRLVVDYSRGTASEFLPDIFRGLGVEVINLNAEHGLIRTVRSAPEYATAYDHLSHIVPALGFDLGVMLDVNGERLQVVDRHGRQVPQPQVLAAMACLVFQARKGAGVAVPVDAPAIFEALASRYGGRIVRTRLDFQAIMAAAGQKGVVLGGDGRGRTIFPVVHPTFDAMFSLVKLLELLSDAHTTLDQLVADLPAWHVQETAVDCPWDRRGRVMRMLGEQYRDRRIRAPDGIKIQLGDEWVLIVPDPDEPQFHIVAEGRTDRSAKALAKKYAGVVAGLQS
jgi:mannose-1-phosphate guanylyltransferase/phosphomannomutase